jgi:hypothetical protein
MSHQKLGFPEIEDVSQRLSIADLFVNKKRSRCGIYLLTFPDGSFYIGQSVNVVGRFAQHKAVHQDITGFTFQGIVKDELNRLERSLIYQAEKLGMSLRNIEHVSSPLGETDLDDVLESKQQKLSVEAPEIFAAADVKIAARQDAAFRERYRRRSETLARNARFPELRRILILYFQQCIPAFRHTEFTFWAVSCLPSTNSDTYPRYFCVSANSMEVFVIGAERNLNGALWGFMNLSKETLSECYKTTKALLQKHPEIEVEQPNYRAAGQDQIRLLFNDVDVVTRLIEDPVIAKASRVLNLRLMRKGATLYSRYHCFDLVDSVLSSETKA